MYDVFDYDQNSEDLAELDRLREIVKLLLSEDVKKMIVGHCNRCTDDSYSVGCDCDPGCGTCDVMAIEMAAKKEIDDQDK